MAICTEEIALTVDARHADLLRRHIASKCGSMAEKLHTAADDFAEELRERPEGEVDGTEFRAVSKEVRMWADLLDGLGWESPPDTAAGDSSRPLVARRDRLQEVLRSALQATYEELEDPRPQGEERRVSEAIRRKADEVELLEDLLDRVEADEEGGG